MPEDTGECPRSGYRAVWIFALFDLPMLSRQQKRRYQAFRKLLEREGFARLQYSVYARYSGSDESAEAFRRHIRQALPAEGQVRLLSVTDRQFGKMEVYLGKSVIATEAAPEQLVLL